MNVNFAKLNFMSKIGTSHVLVLYGSYASYMKKWYPYKDMKTVLNIQFEEMKEVSSISCSFVLPAKQEMNNNRINA